MYTRNILVSFLTLAATIEAFPFSTITTSVSDIKRYIFSSIPKEKRATCPAVWTTISSVLSSDFISTNQCSDDARSAVRAAFHDCFNGGCDGSLVLAGECTNSENKGLSDICGKIGSWATQYGVGVADLIQFAAAHAVVTCPLGPTVTVKVGRKDSTKAGPTGVLPAGTATGAEVYSLFQSKGFSAVELAALIGAHSSGRQFFLDPSQVGVSLDSTPGVWDVKYYGQVIAKNAPFIIPADASLANHSVVGPAFAAFVNNQAGWNAAFAPAMAKLSMLGVTSSSLIDCTSALPKPITVAPVT